MAFRGLTVSGFVFLVGAGPGDPSLVTVAGRDALRLADVVVHDRLAGSALLELARPGAIKIGVGKSPQGPSTAQDEIHRVMIDHARAGRIVVRLKGGDPYVFARGGEEATALLAAMVPFRVIPGISSALAAPAAAGIPLTYRGRATSFTVVTGHGDPWAASETDWGAVAALGAAGGTIVVLMGVATRGEIAARLISRGLGPTTPVAVVRWATRPGQVVRRGELRELGELAVESPAVIVIGDLAALELFGPSAPRVALTRPREQADAWLAPLLRAGWDPLSLPVLDVAVGAGATLATRIEHGPYKWVCLTSQQAVDAVGAAVEVMSSDARCLARLRFAVVGAATARHLWERLRIRADIVGPGRGDALAEMLREAEPGAAIYPCSDRADDSFPVALRNSGRDVDVVVAYSVSNRQLSGDELTAFRTARAVVIASPSAADALAESVDPVDWPAVVAIGARTARALAAMGVVAEVAASADVEGVIGALAAVAPPGGRLEHP